MKLVLCGHSDYGRDGKAYLDKYIINKNLPFPMLYELSNLNLSNLPNFDSWEINCEGDCILKDEILAIKLDSKNYVTFVITEINTNRNWCLIEYDNSLSFRYLTCEDENLNYWGVV